MEGLDPRFYGAALEQWRKDQPTDVRLSQDEVADRLGLSRSTIGKILRGEGKLTYERFLGMCRVLGASVPEIHQTGAQLELDWLLAQSQPAGREEPPADPALEPVKDLEERCVEGFRQIVSALLEAQGLRNRP